MKQKKTPAEPATVQTPDSANLKVNQVFGLTIEMKCIFFFYISYELIQLHLSLSCKQKDLSVP